MQPLTTSTDCAPAPPARVAGLSVGTVTDVAFDESGQIRVTIEVVSAATDLIRGTSSEAIEENDLRKSNRNRHQGLLGDKLIDITVGDRNLPVWNPNDPLIEAGGSGF
ncbi:MAG: hypothetical protein R3A47_04755 [Polyangiales bacterium]